MCVMYVNVIQLPIVMADWDGISIAISFKLWTYLTLSTIGMSTLTPGSRIRLNFPIRSTIQASCWGTNMTIVLMGVLCFKRTGALCGEGTGELKWSWPNTDMAWNDKIERVYFYFEIHFICCRHLEGEKWHICGNFKTLANDAIELYFWHWFPQAFLFLYCRKNVDPDVAGKQIPHGEFPAPIYIFFSYDFWAWSGLTRGLEAFAASAIAA